MFHIVSHFLFSQDNLSKQTSVKLATIWTMRRPGERRRARHSTPRAWASSKPVLKEEEMCLKPPGNHYANHQNGEFCAINWRLDSRRLWVQASSFCRSFNLWPFDMFPHGVSWIPFSHAFKMNKTARQSLPLLFLDLFGPNLSEAFGVINHQTSFN